MRWFIYLAGVLCGLVIGVYASGKVGIDFIIALAVLLAGAVGLMFLAYGWHMDKMISRYGGKKL